MRDGVPGQTEGSQIEWPRSRTISAAKKLHEPAPPEPLRLTGDVDAAPFILRDDKQSSIGAKPAGRGLANQARRAAACRAVSSITSHASWTVVQLDIPAIPPASTGESRSAHANPVDTAIGVHAHTRANAHTWGANAHTRANAYTRGTNARCNGTSGRAGNTAHGNARRRAIDRRAHGRGARTHNTARRHAHRTAIDHGLCWGGRYADR